MFENVLHKALCCKGASFLQMSGAPVGQKPGCLGRVQISVRPGRCCSWEMQWVTETAAGTEVSEDSSEANVGERPYSHNIFFMLRGFIGCCMSVLGGFLCGVHNTA